jgi:hypothetical protein
MRYVRRALPSLVLLLAVSFVGIRPAAAAATPVGQIKTISVPNVPPPAGSSASATWSFDVGWLDAASQRYYLPDRTNFGIDIFDASNATYLATIPGFVGPLPTGTGGPNGVVVVPDQNQVWAGDGNSTVKVADLASRQVIASISTGGSFRADELSYDPEHHLILIGNDRDNPPFLSLISTTSMTVVKKIPMPQATGGIEQSVYDAQQHKFLQAIPATTANPGGEVDVVDPVSLAITQVFPLTNCNPNGAALGPSEQLLLGCGHGATGSQINTQIINATNGSLIKLFPQTGAPDQVWYNSGDNRYYLANTGWTTTGLVGGTPSPVLGVIDASNNTFVQNTPIPTTRSGSVAVNPANNWVFLPINQPANIPFLPTEAGVGVFAAMGGQNLQLTSLTAGGIQFNWQGVPNQPSYTLSRITGLGQTDISVPGGSTNTFVDQLPAGIGACYQLLARDMRGLVASRSNMYCALPGSGSATAGPRNMSIQLAGTGATAGRLTNLSWQAPATGSVTNYLVLPVGTARFQILGPGATSATDNTGGAAVCYLVGSFTSAGFGGIGDATCAIPGLSG